MRGFIILILLSLFSSCASNLTLSSRNCTGSKNWLVENAIVDDFTDQQVFDEKFLIVSGTGEKKIEIHDLLKERKINCRQLTSLHVSIESNWIDAALSFLPLFVFKEIRLRGTYFLSEEDIKRIEEEQRAAELKAEAQDPDDVLPDERTEELGTMETDAVPTFDVEKEVEVEIQEGDETDIFEETVEEPTTETNVIEQDLDTSTDEIKTESEQPESQTEEENKESQKEL